MKRAVFAAGALVVVAVACGQLLIQPARNLFRPSDIAIVAGPDAATNEVSPEYAFLLDSAKAQLILVDTLNGVLRDLHPATPGFNGVFLEGQPAAVAATPDGRRVVVTNFSLGKIQIVCTPIDPACTTPEIVQEIAVGANPEHIAVLDVGASTHAFVTRPNAGVIIDVDLTAGQVASTITVGGEPRALAATPPLITQEIVGAPQFTTQPIASGVRLYISNSGMPAIHRLDVDTGTVTLIPTGFPTNNIFIAPDPTWVYALRQDRGSLLVVDPSTDRLINTRPAGPIDLGPDVFLSTVNNNPITGMAFQTFTAADNAFVGIGQFGYLGGSDGFVYVLNCSGTEAHQLNNRNVVATPIVTGAPALTFIGSPLAVTTNMPLLIGYNNAANSYGVAFTSTPRVVRDEQWAFTYEGPIPAAAPTHASLVATNKLSTFDVNFVELVVPGTNETMVQNGDFVTFVDAPRPKKDALGNDLVAGCDRIQFDSDGRLRRWNLTLLPDEPFSLQLNQEGTDALPNLEDCYSQGRFLYDVRVRAKPGDAVPRAWAVVGSSSGFYGRAPECPATLSDTDCVTRAPDGSQPYAYQNIFFTIFLKAGAAPSQTDLRWSFTIADGVAAGIISINESSFLLAGLPGPLARSPRPSRHVYLVDVGDEALVFLDAANLQLLSVMH